jgi:hypothetical protein
MTKRDAPSLPRQATEPRRLRRLPWPRNLFGELATIEELMAEDAKQTDRCASGCLKTIQAQRVADAIDPLRLQCHLLLVGRVQEPVEPGLDAGVS